MDYIFERFMQRVLVPVDTAERQPRPLGELLEDMDS